MAKEYEHILFKQIFNYTDREGKITQKNIVELIYKTKLNNLNLLS